MTLLTVKGLEKRYAGQIALAGADLELVSGKIIGLLGPNASGKTTLLKIVAGLLQPDKGSIVYPNGAVPGSEAKAAVSFTPDHMVFPDWMKVRDAFQFYRDMYPDFSDDRADGMKSLLELPERKRIRDLSKGIQERLAVGLSFSRKAPLYLLDEPLAGIDPVEKLKILEALVTVPSEECSILLSTHLVKDVETIFDSAFFLYQGRIIHYCEAEALRAQRNMTVEQAYLEVFSHAQPN